MIAETPLTSNSGEYVASLWHSLIISAAGNNKTDITKGSASVLAPWVCFGEGNNPLKHPQLVSHCSAGEKQNKTLRSMITVTILSEIHSVDVLWHTWSPFVLDWWSGSETPALQIYTYIHTHSNSSHQCYHNISSATLLSLPAYSTFSGNH